MADYAGAVYRGPLEKLRLCRWLLDRYASHVVYADLESAGSRIPLWYLGSVGQILPAAYPDRRRCRDFHRSVLDVCPRSHRTHAQDV